MASAKTKADHSAESAMLKAVANPMRLDALRLFNERPIASPNEIANAMGIDVKLLSYHVRVLRECGCIEIVDTAQRRGATEHYYRATERANVTRTLSKLLPQSLREGLTGEAVTAIVRRISEAIDSGVFDARDDRHVAWLPLILDEQGWRDFVEFKAQQLEREMEIATESHERLVGSGKSGIRATAVSLLFEGPE